MTPDAPLPLARARRFGAREIAPLAYGCMHLHGCSPAEARARIDAALEAGITLFDTAPVYGHGADGFGAAEAMLGRLIAEDRGLRDRIVLASKGGIVPPLPYDSRRESLAASVDASLARLNTDRLDLFLVHRPDLLVGPEELAEALAGLVESGKVGAVGVSNFTVAQARALQAWLGIDLLATQPEISPLHLDAFTDGTLDLALETGMVPMAWSPLGGGALMDGSTVKALRGKMAEIAAANDVDEAAVAVGWLLAHPSGILPVMGTNNIARIEKLSDALKVEMDRETWFELYTAALGREVA